jgi:hypothetical protein
MTTLLKIRKLLFPVCLLGLITGTGCKKLVEVPPPLTSTNANIVYGTDVNAIAVLNGIYTTMSRELLPGGLHSLSFYPGLSADELTLFQGATDPMALGYYQNTLTAINSPGIWKTLYSSNYIFAANAAIEGLTASTTLTPEIKQQLLGEARFFRAFCYFYLVNLYGNVPLVLSTDYKENSSIPRSSASDVYTQIVLDLKTAQSLLNTNYLDATLLRPGIDRVVPNKWAATAVLARTYLYMNNFAEAENEASSIIGNKTLYDTVSVDQVFLKNNKESIWQLQSVRNDFANAVEALVFKLPPSLGPSDGNPVYVSKSLNEAFEPADKRKSKWLDSITVGGNVFVFPSKYKINTSSSDVVERTVILRLAEIYLIRAESRAQQGNLTGSVADLNILRKRAGLPDIVATTKDALLKTVLQERQTELFTEWGHRWLDLKRTGNANRVLQPIKGVSWQTTDQLYPIPLEEINLNPALKGQQNPGY